MMNLLLQSKDNQIHPGDVRRGTEKISMDVRDVSNIQDDDAESVQTNFFHQALRAFSVKQPPLVQCNENFEPSSNAIHTDKVLQATAAAQHLEECTYPAIEERI